MTTYQSFNHVLNPRGIETILAATFRRHVATLESVNLPTAACEFIDLIDLSFWHFQYAHPGSDTDISPGFNSCLAGTRKLDVLPEWTNIAKQISASNNCG